MILIDERESPNSRANSISAHGQLEKSLWELGRISRSSRTLGWKEARENYRRALTSLQERQPLGTGFLKELSSPLEAFVGGDEHQNLRIESQPAEVIKITANDQFGVCAFFDPNDVEQRGRHFLAIGNDDPYFYLNRWSLLNSISAYKTQLIGFLKPEREGWLPRICMSQPHVLGDNPSSSLITSSLLKRDFQEVSEAAYYRLEDNILLTDAYPRNVRIQGDAIALFDVVASEPENEVRDWLQERVQG